jgi:hypothetical protein
MNAIRLAALLCCFAPALHALDITRNGITWTITGTPTSGTYANGDPWVVGPIEITAIDPTPTSTRNGTVVNPSLGSTQGFYSGLSAHNAYSGTLNVGDNLPLAVAADSSVVSTISSTATPAPLYGLIVDIAILTVVSSPPADNSFRPTYIGSGSRASAHTTADLDYSRLNALDRSVLSSVPTLASLVDRFDETWYEQDLNWTGRYLHLPYMGVNGYGGNMADQTAQACLSLNLDYTNEEKEDLLIHIVQLGLDYGSILAAGGTWNNDGGHNNGRLAPVLLAAMVLDDATLKSYCADSANRFSEFRQTFFVASEDVARSHTGINGQTAYNYASGDIGKAEWGSTHHTNPTTDNDRWDAPYRDTAGGRMVGAAGVVIALGAQSVIGVDSPLIPYGQRHVYYRNNRYLIAGNYNGYDDGVAYATVRDASGGATANYNAIAPQPFAYNEIDGFAASFFLNYENAPGPDVGADVTGPVISSISSGTPTSTTATITWSTDEGATSRVDYGTTTGYGSDVTASAYVTGHSLEITGLSAETVYHFKVTSADIAANSTESADQTFTTAAAGQDPAADPTFTPDGAVSFDPIAVTLAKTTGGPLEYSLNGVDFVAYSSPLLIADQGTTSVWARVAAGGGYAASGTVTRSFIVGALSVNDQWQEKAFTSRAGTFQATVVVTAPTADSDMVLMLCPAGSVDAFTDGACIVRLNTSNVFDARNGGSYAAGASIGWTAGGGYTIIITGSVATRTYSVTVNGSTLATDYAFRTEHAAATELTTFAVINDVSPFDGLVTYLQVIEPGQVRVRRGGPRSAGVMLP